MDTLQISIAIALLETDGFRSDVLRDSLCIEEMDAADLLELVGRISARLREISETALTVPKPGDRPVDIRITKEHRIFLQGYPPVEIHLKPLTKSVFLLFLRHPEGINFKFISDYESELADIYTSISPRSDAASVQETVSRLVSPQTNSLSTVKSSLKRELKNQISENILSHYTITDGNGKLRRIPLQQTHIIWE